MISLVQVVSQNKRILSGLQSIKIAFFHFFKESSFCKEPHRQGPFLHTPPVSSCSSFLPFFFSPSFLSSFLHSLLPFYLFVHKALISPHFHPTFAPTFTSKLNKTQLSRFCNWKQHMSKFSKDLSLWGKTWSHSYMYLQLS